MQSVEKEVEQRATPLTIRIPAKLLTERKQTLADKVRRHYYNTTFVKHLSGGKSETIMFEKGGYKFVAKSPHEGTSQELAMMQIAQTMPFSVPFELISNEIIVMPFMGKDLFEILMTRLHKMDQHEKAKKTVPSHLTKSGFTLNEFVSIAGNLLYSVAYMHEQDMTHGDIKPENIVPFADVTYSPWGFVLLDYGMAKWRTPFTTKIEGTDGYLDPQFSKSRKVSTKGADVYAAGMSIATMLQGHISCLWGYAHRDDCATCRHRRKEEDKKSILDRMGHSLYTALPSDVSDQLKKQMVTIVCNMIRLEPKKRISACTAYAKWLAIANEVFTVG